MPDRRDVIYLYDGTFDGLLCCVFESYLRRELPLDILTSDTPQLFLCELREIAFTVEGAERVFHSLHGKLGARACEMIQTAFLNGNPGKAYSIFNFIRLGYRIGPKICDMLGDPVVNKVYRLANATRHEAHMMMGFVRFSEYQDGVLASIIEPKHIILPLMQDHFCERFHGEHFLIYDKAHGMACIYKPYQARIIFTEHILLPELDETEREYHRLWAQYHKTIAIESRCNPRCQMGHMPKRFWSHLTEFESVSPRPAQGDHPLAQRTVPTLPAKQEA